MKERPRPRLRRWIARAFYALLTLFLAAIAFTMVDGWTAFGKAATGARRARMERSPQYREGVFVNPQPLYNDWWGMIGLALDASEHRVPASPIRTSTPHFDAPPATGLRVTWLGHSTLLLEIDGHTILTDPIWSERSGPVDWAGPRRWYAPPIALADLPRIDAVVISHDHYDHLDYDTISAMRGWDTTFIVPLGVASHLVYWGVPEERIVEMDWWEETRVGELAIVCTPARHASGRTLIDNDSTLWASYAFLGARHRVYFSGDTGLFPALEEIGERYGPFDLTMIEAGAYGSAWPDWHLGPEQAVLAHTMVRGRVMLPVHWGLFDLAYHGWTEPIERVLAAAQERDVVVLAPRPGESVEPEAPQRLSRWWPDVPWRTGAEDPIVATKMGRR